MNETKYYCDKCGKEISVENIKPVTLGNGRFFDKSIELCQSCYKEIFSFLD